MVSSGSMVAGPTDGSMARCGVLTAVAQELLLIAQLEQRPKLRKLHLLTVVPPRLTSTDSVRHLRSARRSVASETALYRTPSSPELAQPRGSLVGGPGSLESAWEGTGE